MSSDWHCGDELLLLLTDTRTDTFRSRVRREYWCTDTLVVPVAHDSTACEC